MTKRSASAIAVVLLALVAFPVMQHGREEPRDSFPFSHYPMFSKARGKSLDMICIEGVHADGTTQYLPIEWVGVGGFHQVRKQINRSAETGQLTRLARRAARVVAARSEPEYAEIVRIRFARAHFDIGEYFAGNKTPTRREELVSVAVERTEFADDEEDMHEVALPPSWQEEFDGADE